MATGNYQTRVNRKVDSNAEDKVITTMVIRPLDDHTCHCARSAVAHLGIWRKLYDCTWHRQPMCPPNVLY